MSRPGGQEEEAMKIDDPELHDLCREAPSQMAHEGRHSGRAPGAGRERGTESQHGGFTIALRVKPDRRLLLTFVDPEHERRRR